MECHHQNVVKELSEQTNLDYSVGTTCPSGILLEQCRLIPWTHTDFEWIKPANSIDINYLPFSHTVACDQVEFPKTYQ